MPIAYRSPIAHISSYTAPDSSEVLLDFDRFLIFRSGEDIGLSYQGKPRLCACISPLGAGASLPDQAVENIKSYIFATYNLYPHIIPRASAISTFEKLVLRISEYCGCLTDICREDKKDREYEFHSASRTKGGFLAISLPIIALMYRRISALRGFNFRVSFSESIPCLGFSAKVLLDGENPKLSDIPEYSALCELADSDSLIIAARLTKIDEEDGEMIRKLSVVICPQEIDPRGILRAPEIIKKKKGIIESFNFDIPGKY